METGFIYCLLHPNTKEIRYVGQTTKSLNSRLSGHISYANRGINHKNNWIKSLQFNGLKPCIEQLDIVPIDELNFWEQHYISLYKSWGVRLTNIAPGGKDTMAQSTKDKLRASGVYEKIAKRNKLNSPAKKTPVLQYDLLGNLIKRWNSVMDASRSVNIGNKSIIAACTGEQKTAAGSKWRYENNDFKSKLIDYKLPILSEFVILDTETGIYYTNAKEVSNAFNINHRALVRKLRGIRNNNTKFIIV